VVDKIVSWLAMHVSVLAYTLKRRVVPYKKFSENFIVTFRFFLLEDD